MDQWADLGVEPPASNYPTLAGHGRDGDRDDEEDDKGKKSRQGKDEPATLVSLEEASESFPAIPGVSFPTVMNQYELLDFGHDFGKTGGILTLQPPVLGPATRCSCPGPTRTASTSRGSGQCRSECRWHDDGLEHTGAWPSQPGPLRSDRFFHTVARTKAERLASGDPRLSLEERYTNHEGFVSAVRAAARQLVRERFLLQVDADGFINAAEASDVLR